jgi:hypothetical protein
LDEWVVSVEVKAEFEIWSLVQWLGVVRLGRVWRLVVVGLRVGCWVLGVLGDERALGRCLVLVVIVGVWLLD